ncbi:uncharacterized protein [Diadema setosum]|uniref:uncharacterized protein n=1 Tax=Diadema setosum TaxID=31175 RepID=UPI003B3A2D81
MHTVTNFFLANLALADLLVAIFCVIPQLLWYVMENWPLGDAMCRLHKYMISAATTASILLLTVISVERYIAILHPLETRRVLTTRRLTVTVMLVWLLSAVVNIPLLLFYQADTYGEIVYCMTAPNLTLRAGRIHGLTFFVFFYALPLTIMSVLYGIISRKLWTTSTGKRVFTSGDGGGFQRGTGSRFTSRITGRFSRAKTNSTSTANTNHTSANIYRPDNEREGTVILEMNNVGKTKDGVVKSKLEEVTKESEPPKNQKIGPFFVHEPTSEEDPPVNPDPDVKLPLMNEGNNNANGPKVDTKAVAVVSSSSPKESKQRDHKLSRNQSSASVVKGGSSKRGNDEISSGRARGKGRDNVMAARKKVIRLLVIIVASFALCLFPAQLQVLLHSFGYDEILTSHGGIIFLPFSHALYFVNSALNPFLYAFFSDNFRAKFKQTLKPRSHSHRMSSSSKPGLQRLHSMTSYAQTEVVYVSS